MKKISIKRTQALLISLILALCLGCATKNIVQAPTGRIEVQSAAFNQYTPEQDIEIGRQAVAEVNRQMPVLPDSNPVSKYVQQLGQQLAAHAPGPVKWNFGKFLIGRDGKVLARFDSATTPDSKELTTAVERALAAK